MKEKKKLPLSNARGVEHDICSISNLSEEKE